jgi:hypothetical protein
MTEEAEILCRHPRMTVIKSIPLGTADLSGRVWTGEIVLVSSSPISLPERPNHGVRYSFSELLQ